MTIKTSRRVILMAGLAALASAAGTVISRADPPGYLFMDLNDNHAMVAQVPQQQAKARISQHPTRLPDDIATVIARDAEPVGSDRIILAYKGQLYILPDKDLGAGTMASHAVREAARHRTD